MSIKIDADDQEDLFTCRTDERARTQPPRADHRQQCLTLTVCISKIADDRGFQTLICRNVRTLEMMPGCYRPGLRRYIRSLGKYQAKLHSSNVFSKLIQETESDWCGIGSPWRFARDQSADFSPMTPVRNLIPLWKACLGRGDTRLKKFGPNLVARERKATIAEELWSRARNPLNALLLSLAVVSYFLGRRPRRRRDRRHGGIGDHDRLHPGTPVK